MRYRVEALPSHLLQSHHVPLASSLSCHCTVLLFCVAIAARAPFEGVTTFLILILFDSSMRVAPEIQSWGEGPTLRESPYRDSCTFEALAKQKKMPLTTVAISTDQCTAKAESVQGVRKLL